MEYSTLLESYLIPVDAATESINIKGVLSKIYQAIRTFLDKLIDGFKRAGQLLRGVKDKFRRKKAQIPVEKIPDEKDEPIINFQEEEKEEIKQKPNTSPKKRRYLKADSNTPAHKAFRTLQQGIQNYMQLSKMFCSLGIFLVEEITSHTPGQLGSDYDTVAGLLTTAENDVTRIRDDITNLNTTNAIEQLRRDPRYLLEMATSLEIGITSTIERLKTLRARVDNILSMNTTNMTDEVVSKLQEFRQLVVNFSNIGTGWLNIAVMLGKVASAL